MYPTSDDIAIDVHSKTRPHHPAKSVRFATAPDTFSPAPPQKDNKNNNDDDDDDDDGTIHPNNRDSDATRSLENCNCDAQATKKLHLHCYLHAFTCVFPLVAVMLALSEPLLPLLILVSMQYPVSAFHSLALAVGRIPLQDACDNDWFRLALTIHHSTLTAIAALPPHRSFLFSLSAFAFNLYCVSLVWGAPPKWSPLHVAASFALCVLAPLAVYSQITALAIVLAAALAVAAVATYAPSYTPLAINLALVPFYSAVAAAATAA